jgi:glycosyltransferase involved in cell wall biosynthesis
MKLIWLARVLATALAGALWRFARKLAGRKPRIWHGMQPLHLTPPMVRADRIAGYPSRNVAVHTRQLGYALVTNDDFDAVFSDEGIAGDSLHWRALTDLLLHGDIWVAYFDCHFFPHSRTRRNELVMALVRAMGIHIVVATHGSDIIQILPVKSRFDWVGRMQLDYPNWSFEEQTSISRRRTALFGKYADLVLPAHPALLPFVPRSDVLFEYFPVDIPETPAIPEPHDGPVVIVHAPNHRHVKGTGYVLKAVERLKASGFAIELLLIEGVPRREALAIYRRADIIVDQLIIGAYGLFALEGISLGKPVLTYLDQEHLGNHAFNLPLVNAHPENVDDVLAALIAVPELRTRLGISSREAAIRYQSPEALAEVWDRLYRHVWRREPLALETTVHFDPKRGTRSLSEDPKVEEFWPVSVSDLMPAIRDAINRLR